MIPIDEIGRQGGQSVVVAVRPPVLNRDIAALDVSGVAKVFSKRCFLLRARCEAAPFFVSAFDRRNSVDSWGYPVAEFDK